MKTIQPTNAPARSRPDDDRHHEVRPRLQARAAQALPGPPVAPPPLALAAAGPGADGRRRRSGPDRLPGRATRARRGAVLCGEDPMTDDLTNAMASDRILSHARRKHICADR